MDCSKIQVQLTAYVLGEGTELERERVQAHLGECPACRAAVAETRETADLLAAQLAAEPAPALTAKQRRVIERAPTRPPRRSRVFVSRWWMVGWPVAAALLFSTLCALVWGPDSVRQAVLPGQDEVRQSVSLAGGEFNENAFALVTPSPTYMNLIAPAPDAADPLRGTPFRLSGLNPEALAGIDLRRLGVGEWAALESTVVDSAAPAAVGITRSGGLGLVGTTATILAGTDSSGPDYESHPVWRARGPFEDVGAVTFAGGQRLRHEVKSGSGTLTLAGDVTVTGNAKFQDGHVPWSARPGLGIRDDNINTRGWSYAYQIPGVDTTDFFGGSHERQPGFNTEQYDAIVENPFLAALDNPLSTFSIDVDTASYSNLRRFLNGNQLPPKGAVRIEELVNYFPYDYPSPDEGAPFSANVETAGCPWNDAHRLVRIGLKGREIAPDRRPASNLVFLLDVSGSMRDANKLPLVKKAMRLLVGQLTENDRVAITVYAGSAGQVLPSTPGDRHAAIMEAIDRLDAGGSTAGGEGIVLAYRVAAEHFVTGGVNRVILCTDGDFNVGVSDDDALVRLIEEKAKSGVFLTVLGFGMGNYKDGKMEKLADNGNGNYAYIDTAAEARKVLVEQLSGTLVTIAKDVKIQVEFNPARVAAYRLIGYENRMLRKEDFNDDTKDAGEIGAGHQVTALYEVVPAAAPLPPTTQPDVDPLKYQHPASLTPAAGSEELLTLKLRYKAPDGDVSTLVQFPAIDGGAKYSAASGDFKFAASVAAFGMLLRDSRFKGNASFDQVLELAAEGKGDDRHGYRAEFLELVGKAKRLSAK